MPLDAFPLDESVAASRHAHNGKDGFAISPNAKRVGQYMGQLDSYLKVFHIFLGLILGKMYLLIYLFNYFFIFLFFILILWVYRTLIIVTTTLCPSM